MARNKVGSRCQCGLRNAQEALQMVNQLDRQHGLCAGAGDCGCAARCGGAHEPHSRVCLQSYMWVSAIEGQLHLLQLCPVKARLLTRCNFGCTDAEQTYP